MVETGNHFMGWPTHMADGHNLYTVVDWYWRMGSLDITLENQKLCIRYDENSEEYVTDTANLMSYIDIILKYMRTTNQSLHEQGSDENETPSGQAAGQAQGQVYKSNRTITQDERIQQEMAGKHRDTHDENQLNDLKNLLPL